MNKKNVLCSHPTTNASPILRSMQPVFSLRSDLNQLFDGLFNDWFDAGPNQKGVEAWGNFKPKLNIEQRESDLLVTLEVPGMSSEDIDISLTEGILTIKGHKKEDFDRSAGNNQYVGRSYGEFEQRIPLNVEINEDEVEASAENGVLTLRLPKKEPAKDRVRKISVKSK